MVSAPCLSWPGANPAAPGEARFERNSWTVRELQPPLHYPQSPRSGRKPVLRGRAAKAIRFMDDRRKHEDRRAVVEKL